MFHVLLDTSVWLDLAEDPRQTSLFHALHTMLLSGRVNLILPRLVLAEFQNSKKRVADRAQRSLSSHFNIVRDAIKRAGGKGRTRNRVLKYLGDLDHKMPLMGGVAAGVLDRIEDLLTQAVPIETSDGVKTRAADRALRRAAPCHRDNKNSIADAMLIEIYADCVRNGEARDRFAFVTHNKNDFSQIGDNHKVPHHDVASIFSRIRSLYFISLADCLRRIDPALTRELLWEFSATEEVRSLSEILEALDTLTTQVWHNRHKNTEWRVQRGQIKVVTRDEWEANARTGNQYPQNHIIDSVWEGALKSGKKAEKKLGEGNYGPWTDFEWGMINGKLSALRWVLGDEWDMLDT